MLPGEKTDGSGRCTKAEEQVLAAVDSLYVMEVDDKQLVIKLDHSAGYANICEDALHVGDVNTIHGESRSFVVTQVSRRGA